MVDPPQQSDNRERRFQEGKKLWADPNKKAYYEATVEDMTTLLQISLNVILKCYNFLLTNN